MLTIEEKLKDLIIKKYGTMSEFTAIADIPNTTMVSILSRGLDKTNVINVIKICKTLGISADALAEGKISKSIPHTLEEDVSDLNNIIDFTKKQLLHNGIVTLDGVPITQSNMVTLIDAIDIGVELIRRKNNQQKRSTDSENPNTMVMD